ncbi:glycosyltransferase [Novosphingobium sp.]|uniref:glycosyltransferase n=1 Tax=Novosphingobium sp. TaxID=1874826 RepID=UPI003B529536
MPAPGVRVTPGSALMPKRSQVDTGAPAPVRRRTNRKPAPRIAPANQVAPSETERLLCAPDPLGAIDAILPRNAGAWTMQLRGLDSFTEPEAPRAPIRICIAAEQITGPVRNGGIGTTYAALALLLADAGFDVTVLYLRGQESEINTIDFWIADYAAQGVKLVPVPDYATADRFVSGADRWLRAPYNMLRWLIEHPMDVVHVSEWRGSGYLAMLAKRTGIACTDTLFVVKTSSPWMWNRLYGSNLVERVDDLVKIHAERQSVELADVVIGGSLHLLRWMASQGYAVPQSRAFVQPNVVSFDTLQPLINTRALPHGTRTPIDEFVFFGRLEARKGLFVFCQAIRRLIRKGVALPAKITFMGKPGARLPSHPDQDTPDFILDVSKDWPCEVQIISSYQQYEAIEYLLSGKRLAVMPSIIENSSMAIYEAAICAIPAVATNVGGNAELIDAGDHAAVLCAPHPVSLGDRLEQALTLGGMVPRPSFDNHANLATWRRFHRQLSAGLREKLLDATRAQPAAIDAVTAVCIYFTGDADALDATLASLAAQSPARPAVVVAVDAVSNADGETAAALMLRHGFDPVLVDAFDLDAGPAFNAAAARAAAPWLLFVWEGATLVPCALGELARGAACAGADVVNYLVRAVDPAGLSGTIGPLHARLIVSPSHSFFSNDIGEMPLFVRRNAFQALGGFTTDYRVTGYDHEFVARALLAGTVCQTVLREFGSIVPRSSDWLRQRGYDAAAGRFRAIRPGLAAAPLAMRDAMLLARGLQARSGSKPRQVIDPATPEGMLVRMIAGVATEEAAAATDHPVAKAERRAVIASKPRSAKPRTRNEPDPLTDGLVKAGERLGAKISARAETAAPAPARPRAKPRAMPAQLRALVQRQEAATDGTRIGQVLGVYEGRLYGWVTDLANPAEPVGVELIIDGARGVWQGQLADRSFAPFAALPGEAARHGFVIDLPPSPAASKGAIGYAVAATGGGLVLGDGLVLPRASTIETCGIDAGCLPGDDGVVRGWARRIKDAARPVDVALFANGVFLGRARADQPSAQGAFGFALPVPRLFREAGRHRIDVVIARLGLPLPGLPVWIEGSSVAVAKLRAKPPPTRTKAAK